MANTTTILGIPLITGNMIVSKTAINNALNVIDANALPKSHALSGVHWAGWKANQPFSLSDVIRLTTMNSWGYLECTTAGISGGTEPGCPYSPGDTTMDGSVVWTLRQIGGVIAHKTLSGRSLPDQHPIQAITGLQAALDDKASLTQLEDRATAAETLCKDYTDDKITALIGGAPSALDTLKELADAMVDETDAIAVITASLANKVDKVAGKALSTNDYDNTAKGKVDKITVTVPVNLDTLNTNNHTHANKALLDTYTQTEANLASAVTLKHSHANKAVLDQFTEVNGKVVYKADRLATKKDIVKYAIVL